VKAISLQHFFDKHKGQSQASVHDTIRCLLFSVMQKHKMHAYHTLTHTHTCTHVVVSERKDKGKTLQHHEVQHIVLNNSQCQISGQQTYLLTSFILAIHVGFFQSCPIHYMSALFINWIMNTHTHTYECAATVVTASGSYNWILWLCSRFVDATSKPTKQPNQPPSKLHFKTKIKKLNNLMLWLFGWQANLLLIFPLQYPL